MNLADNAWHTVSVVRVASGKVSLVSDCKIAEVFLYTDGDLVKEEEELFEATTPTSLVASLKSAYQLRTSQVFSGDVGPLRIYNTGLSIG